MLSILRSQAAFYSALYGLLFATMYYPAFDWLVTHDWPREDYNYCYLVPFLVLYLIWEKRGNWLIETPLPSWHGLFLVLPGILLFWFGELAGEYFSLYISSWLLGVGLLWLHAGWKKVRIIVFPIFVSLFLFPLPEFINTKLTFNLKLISSQIGIKIIQLCGMSAYREGNVIDLGFTQLQVVDACSGLRYLIPLFLMGVLMAYFSRAPYWKKIIIILTTIPLSIGGNSLRIAITALLYPIVGPAAAEGFLHDFSGWAIFMVSFVILVVEIMLLGKIMPRSDEGFLKKKDIAGSLHENPDSSEQRNLISKTKVEKVFFMQPQFIVALVLLATSIAAHSFVDFREKKPASRPFSEFPLAIGEWTGERQFLDKHVIDVLEFSDYTSIDYLKQGSPPVNVYVAYYESQRKGKSIHSPETCMPGSGWTFKQAGTLAIPLPGKQASSITVMRAMIERGTNSQLVYYWFNQRGRILTNAYEMKLYNFWDALVQKRTDGALIRVISPLSSSEKIEDADKRLQNFIKGIMPTLKEFIPEQAV